MSRGSENRSLFEGPEPRPPGTQPPPSDALPHAKRHDQDEKGAKDEALESVAGGAEPWFEMARVEAARSLPPGEITGEGIREYLTEIEHVGSPHHPNAWGALVSQLVKDRVIEPTGRWVPMRAKGSHARRTPEYRAVRS